MEPPFAIDDSQQFCREETTDDAVYNVYLKQIHYNTSTDDSLVQDRKAHLQWRLEESRVIKCGTLEKLVEALSTPSGDIDLTFVDPFLGTYRSFTSPKDLMEAIIKRYNDVGYEISQNETENCRRSLKSVLHIWLDSYPDDFREPPAYPALSLLEKIAQENFPDSDLMQKVMQKRAIFLKEEEERNDALFGPVEDLAVIFRCYILDNVREIESLESSTDLLPPLDVLSIPSRLFAEQLTYIDAELFQKVIPYHCLGSIWSNRTNKNQTVQPVTVYATVDQFNAVSHRVMASILKWPYLNAEDRATVIEKWIDIAQECRLLKNFSSLKAIISGLQSSSVYRLKSIWHLVPRDKVNLFKDLANIFSEENNQSLWREVLNREGTAKSVDPETISTLRGYVKKKGGVRRKSTATDFPDQMSTMQGTVPYLGTFLTDLTMLDTAFRDFIRDDFINFEKKRKEFELLAQIQMLQSSASLYRIEPNHVFFDWFYDIRIYDPNECHELSLEIEPNDTYPMVERRIHKRSGSSGFSLPRRPSSMEDIQLYRDSLISFQKDEDSRSMKSEQELSFAYQQSEGRNSISGYSVKSYDAMSMSSMSISTLTTATKASLAAKVFLFTSENLETNHYKSILLNNNDHAQTVLRNILDKYGILNKPEDYVLFQLLPDKKEILLPERGNIFYAIKKDVGDIKFAVRKRFDMERHKVKHSRTKNRLSKFLLNV